MFPDARDCRMLLILQESIILNPVSSTHSHAAAKYPQIICSEPPTGAHRACCCLHIVGGITRNSGFFLPCLVISCMYHWQNLKGIQSGKCSFRLLTLVIRGIVQRRVTGLNASRHSLPPDVLFILHKQICSCVETLVNVQAFELAQNLPRIVYICRRLRVFSYGP